MDTTDKISNESGFRLEAEARAYALGRATSRWNNANLYAVTSGEVLEVYPGAGTARVEELAEVLEHQYDSAEDEVLREFAEQLRQAA